MKPERNKMLKGAIRPVLTAVAAAVLFFCPPPLFADVFVSDKGATLEVTATSAYSGKGLVLLWDTTDKSTSGDWANTNSIPGVVGSSGSVFTVDLNALGIPNGAYCQIAAGERYIVIEKVWNNKSSAAVVNTGIKDTEIFGLILKCYATHADRNGAYIYTDTTGCENTTEVFCLNTVNNSLGYFRFYNRGSFNTSYNHETYYDQGSMHVFALTNGVLTVDGGRTRNSSGTATTVTYTDGTSFGNTGGTLVLGGGTSAYNIGCWWGKVIFYGSDGNEILNYTPVKAATRSDTSNVAGFWDSVSKSFKTTNNSAMLVDKLYDDVAAETGEYIYPSLETVATFTVNRNLTAEQADGACTVTVPAGLAGEDLLLLWDTEDKSATGEWAHTNVLAEMATSGQQVSVRLGRLGIKNGDYAVLAARHNLSLLETMSMEGGTKCSVNTGVKDTDLYGLRIGYYMITPSRNASTIAIGSMGTGFYLLDINSSKNYLRCYINGSQKYGSTDRQLYLWTDGTNYNQINNIAVTNGVYTLEGKLADYNGTARNSNKYTAGIALGSSTNTVWTGWGGTDNNYRQEGCWSYIQMDGKDGQLILDYVPATRNSDGTVGFYDRATGSFIVPTGSNTATAGTVTDAAYKPINAIGEAFEVTSIHGLIIMFR